MVSPYRASKRWVIAHILDKLALGWKPSRVTIVNKKQEMD